MENAEFEDESNNLDDSDNYDEIENGKKNCSYTVNAILNFFIANNADKLKTYYKHMSLITCLYIAI